MPVFQHNSELSASSQTAASASYFFLLDWVVYSSCVNVDLLNLSSWSREIYVSDYNNTSLS